MTFEKIDYSLDMGVAFVRLNEPGTLNAMTVQMGEELRAAVDLAGKEARALVIGSVGRAFSSGANLADGGFDLDDPQRDAGSTLDSTFNPLMLELRAAPIPVVTAIRGAAAGVGCAIALMGDVIVAGEGAYFLQAFRRVGLVPDGGSTYLLAKAIGRVRAMEMMLLGDRLPAAKALDWGLITRLMPDEAVDTTAMDIARELASGPTRALAIIRQSAWAALETDFERQLERERADQREAGRTEDFIEGVAAFLEKRPARFRGA
jgi:2-(1,2-epoxy-1,2-dihydrophenyl)acetyl-CoA isomerase